MERKNEMSKRPNIVAILIDDMGWKDLSYCGSDFYESPNLDKLKEQGMYFSRAYAACPVCSPSRASFLTGKYPATVGVTNWIAYGGAHPRYGRLIDAPYIDHIPLEETTLAHAFKEGGYSTWHVGKWHLGTDEYYPDKVGFDVNIAGCHWGRPRNGYWMPCGIPTLPDGPEGEYLTDRLTDEAINLIKNRDEEKPFYLNLWYYDVHHPFNGKPEHIAYFEEKAKRMGLDKMDPFEVGEDLPCVHLKGQKVVRRKFHSDPVYASMIYNLDYNVGRLVEYLEAEGLMDDTIILFTSDNGGLATSKGSPTCNAPAREGKGWVYDGGTRVPAFITWRGHIRPGSCSDEAICTPDIYPTLLDLAGLPLRPEQHVDGLSLKGVIEEKETLPERPLFWHYPHYSDPGGTPAAIVMYGEYKLIEFFEDMHIELYNLAKDPSELHNLRDEMPEKATELLTMLHNWQKSINAKMPEVNPNFEPW